MKTVVDKIIQYVKHTDLGLREVMILVPFVITILILGLAPNLIVAPSEFGILQYLNNGIILPLDGYYEPYEPYEEPSEECKVLFKELGDVMAIALEPIKTVQQFCVVDIFTGKLVCPSDFKTTEAWESYAYWNIYWDIMAQTEPQGEFAKLLDSIRADNGLKPFVSTFLEDVKDDKHRQFANYIIKKHDQMMAWERVSEIFTAIADTSSKK
jgi:hypothetical protein